MAFDSLQAFLSMGGRGPYVWTCYAAFFVTMVVITRWSINRRRKVITQVKRKQRLSSRSRA